LFKKNEFETKVWNDIKSSNPEKYEALQQELNDKFAKRIKELEDR